VALLLRDREAAPEAATPPPNGGPPAAIPDFACETCGAAMQGGQDWCLECGTAARGRLGARPGWRAAFTVVGLTLLLVCGAVLASYAALTSDAERTASAPTAGSGKPLVAQAPTPAVPGPPPTTIQPGATGPGTTPPAVTPGATPVAPGVGPTTAGRPVIPTTRPVIPPSKGVIPPTASAPGTPSTGAAAPPSAGATKPAAGNGAPATQQSATANVAPQLIALKPGAAQTYDPAKRAGAEFGPAGNAVDGKLGSLWDVTVPADGNPLGVGLLVDLGAPYALQALRLATDTPGFRAELYGAVDKAVPVDVLDKRWQHLTDAKSVGNGDTISLKGKGEAPKYRLFLVYVTVPADRTDPRAAINELQLRGTP
jgi:hypothetical protein